MYMPKGKDDFPDSLQEAFPEFREFYTTGLFTAVKKDDTLSTEIRAVPGKEKKKCVRLPCSRKQNS